jgi:hypothetical protein
MILHERSRPLGALARCILIYFQRGDTIIVSTSIGKQKSEIIYDWLVVVQRLNACWQAVDPAPVTLRVYTTEANFYTYTPADISL